MSRCAHFFTAIDGSGMIRLRRSVCMSHKLIDSNVNDPACFHTHG
jgi:hypothetical protein